MGRPRVPGQQSRARGERRAEALGLMAAGRTREVEAALHVAGVQVAGIQEARLPGPLEKDGHFYHMFGSGAVKGNLGTHVWISKEIFSQVTVLFEAVSARVGAAWTKGLAKKTLFLALHAPHARSGAAEVQTFLSEVRGVLDRAWRGGWRVIGLGDMNAALGSVDSDSFSLELREEENARGTEFRELMEGYGLFALSTIHGTAFTYFGAGGPKRYDYVFGDADLLPGAGPPETLPDSSFSTGHKPDHCPVRQTLGGVGPAIARRRGWRPPLVLDRTKLQDPGARAHAEVILRREALYLADPLQVDDHSDALVAAFHKAADECFMSPLTSVPKRDWISPDTWGAMADARALRNAAFALQRRVRRSVLLLVVRAWSCLSLPAAVVPTVAEWEQGADVSRTRADLIAHPYFMHLAGKAQRAYREDLRKDLDAHVDGVVAAAEAAAARNDTAECFRLTKSLGWRPPKPPAGIKDEQGIFISERDGIDARWRRHLSSVLSGRLADVSELRAARSRLHCTGISAAQLQELMCRVDAAVGDVLGTPWWQRDRTSRLPTLGELAPLIQKVKGHRALGQDRLSMSVVHATGELGTWLVVRLVRVALLVGRAPLAVHIGRGVFLYKKGDPYECDNFRGLNVLDHIGKPVTGILKPMVDEAAARLLPDTQAGGMKGRTIDGVSLLSRAWVDVCRGLGRPGFLLFVDLRQAFDRICRELAVGPPPGMSVVAFAGRLVDRGFDPTVAREIAEEFMVAVPLVAGGMPCGAAEMVRELHDPVLTTVGGDASQAVAGDTGTRQGCSLGAVLFQVAYARFVRAVLQGLRSAGLLHVLRRHDGAPWPADAAPEVGRRRAQPAEVPGQNEALGPDEDGDEVSSAEYVDDAVFAVMLQVMAELDGTAGQAVDILCQVTKQYVVVLNWSEGKTEVLVIPCGKGSRKWLQAYNAGGAAQWRVSPSGQRYHFTLSYVHVGTLVTHDATLTADAARLRSRGCVAYGRLGRTFHSARSRVPRNVSLLKSLVHSTALTGVGTWPRPSAAVGRSMEAAFSRWLRGATHDERHAGAVEEAAAAGAHLATNEELRARHEVPSFFSLLREKRLQLAQQVVRSAPRGLRTLLATYPQHIGWCRAVAEDLAELASDPRCGGLPPPGADPGPWLTLLADSFFTELLRAARSPASPWTSVAVPTHVDRDDAEASNSVHRMGLSVCLLCDRHRAFVGTRAGVATHAFGAHRTRTAWAAWVTTPMTADGTPLPSRCEVCLRTWPTRRKAVAHIAFANATCRRFAAANEPPLTPDEVDTIHRQVAGWQERCRAAARAAR